MELSRNFKVLLNLDGAKVKITYSIFDDASHSVAKHLKSVTALVPRG